MLWKGFEDRMPANADAQRTELEPILQVRNYSSH